MYSSQTTDSIYLKHLLTYPKRLSALLHLAILINIEQLVFIDTKHYFHPFISAAA